MPLVRRQHMYPFGRIRFSLASALMLVTLIACALGAYTWLFRWPTVGLSGGQLGHVQHVVVKANSSNRNDGDALKVSIVGHLNGQADLKMPWGDTLRIGPGRVNVSRYQEYYGETATFDYAPVDATDGELTISYHFEGLLY